MSHDSLHLVVSTGQNWANLQSIAGCGFPPGRMLWIESPLARKEDWSRGMTRLVEGMGWVLEPPLTLDEEVTGVGVEAFGQALRKRLRHVPREIIHVHLNGGTKLMQAALQVMVGPNGTYHYSEGGDHTFRSPESGWMHRPSIYRPVLEDLLACYGFIPKIEPMGDPLTWPAEDLWNRMNQVIRPEPPSNPAQYILESRSPEEWKVSYSDWKQRQGCRTPRESLSADWSGIIEPALKWAGKRALEAAKPPQGLAVDPMGDAFEQAVRPYLDAAADRIGVVERAMNLKVMTNAGANHTEVDHLWLMPSGQVVVFECKSAWSTSEKDMQSRLRKWTTCFGLKVLPVLVFPAPVSPYGELPFSTHKLWNLAGTLGMKTLVLPLDEQLGLEPEPLGLLESVDAQLHRLFP